MKFYYPYGTIFLDADCTRWSLTFSGVHIGARVQTQTKLNPLPFFMEKWKNIPEWEGMYQASNIGRIKSLTRKGRLKDVILLPYKNPGGYLTVFLRTPTLKKYLSVHRLVMLAFFPDPGSQQLMVNHKNGIKTDNRLENLEWCTAKENVDHAFKNGLNNKHKPFLRKLDKDNIPKVIEAHRSGMTQRSIADFWGMHHTSISRIIKEYA